MPVAAAPPTADETLYRLSLVDLPAATVDAFWAARTPPTSARLLHSRGITPYRAERYFQARYVTGWDDVNRLAGGFISPEVAVEYDDAGFDSVDIVLQLSAAGIVPHRSNLYRSAGARNAEQMLALAAAGITPTTAITLHDFGLRGADEMLDRRLGRRQPAWPLRLLRILTHRLTHPAETT